MALNQVLATEDLPGIPGVFPACSHGRAVHAPVQARPCPFIARAVLMEKRKRRPKRCIELPGHVAWPARPPPWCFPFEKAGRVSS